MTCTTRVVFSRAHPEILVCTCILSFRLVFVFASSIPVEKSGVSTRSYEERVTVASVLRGRGKTDTTLSRRTESVSTRVPTAVLPAATGVVECSRLVNVSGVGTTSPLLSGTAEGPTAVISPSLATSLCSTDWTSVISPSVAGIPTSRETHTTQPSLVYPLSSVSSLLRSSTAGSTSQLSRTLGTIVESAVESHSGNLRGMSITPVFHSVVILTMLTESAIATSSATAYSVSSYGFSSLISSMSSSAESERGMTGGISVKRTSFTADSGRTSTNVASVSPSGKLSLSTEDHQSPTSLLISLLPSVIVSTHVVSSSDSRGLHLTSVVESFRSLSLSRTLSIPQTGTLLPSRPLSSSATSSQTRSPSRTLSIPQTGTLLPPRPLSSSATSSQTRSPSRTLSIPQTGTLSPSRPFSSSAISSQTRSPSRTLSIPQTGTLSPSRPFSSSATSSQTRSPSRTLSIPQTGTLSPSRPFSSSAISSQTRSPSRTLSIPQTGTLSPSRPLSSSAISSQTRSPSRTLSIPQTGTLSPSRPFSSSAISSQTRSPSRTLSIPQTGTLSPSRPFSSSAISSQTRDQSVMSTITESSSPYISMASDSVVELSWIPSTVFHTSSVFPSLQQSPCPSGTYCNSYSSSVSQSYSGALFGHSFVNNTPSSLQPIDPHSSQAISESFSFTLPQGQTTQARRPSATVVLSSMSSVLQSTVLSPSPSGKLEVNVSSEMTLLRSNTLRSSLSAVPIATSTSLANASTVASGAVLPSSSTLVSRSILSFISSTSQVTVTMSRSATGNETITSTTVTSSGMVSKIDSHSSTMTASLGPLSSSTGKVSSTGLPTGPFTRKTGSTQIASLLLSHRQSRGTWTSLVSAVGPTSFMDIRPSSFSISVPGIATVFPTEHSLSAMIAAPSSSFLNQATTRKPLHRSLTAHTVTSLSDSSSSPNFTYTSTVNRHTTSLLVPLTLTMTSAGLFSSSPMDTENSVPLTPTKATTGPYTSNTGMSTVPASASAARSPSTVKSTAVTSSRLLVLPTISLLQPSSFPKYFATQTPNISTAITTTSTPTTEVVPTRPSQYLSESVVSVSLTSLYRSVLDTGLTTAISTRRHQTNLPQTELGVLTPNRMSSATLSSIASVQTATATSSLQSVSGQSPSFVYKSHLFSSSIVAISSAMTVTNSPSSPPTSGGSISASSSNITIIAAGVAGGLSVAAVIVVVVVLLLRRKTNRTRHGSDTGNKVKETARRWREPESTTRTLETHQNAIE